MQNRTFLKFLLSFSFVLLMTSFSVAQMRSGVVKDKDGTLPGAFVVVKGTNLGTTTNENGEFTINATAGQSLEISFVGFKTKEVIVTNDLFLDIRLDPDNQLDEVVVIGYGTQKKSDLTGSVSSVSAKDIAKVPNSRVDQALQGRAAGVQVTQTSGAPGAGTSIRVRGGNSITGSNEPLWVIDGIIVGTNFNLNNINSNDIQSIEILKDASSIAIYGSRGANGVVLVTTKSGKGAGGTKPEITASVYSGIQLVPRIPELLSQEEQIAYTNEDARFRRAAEPFPGNPSDYPNIDWFGSMMDPSPIYNADLSIAGSSENATYYNSINYFNQDGLLKNSGIEKFIYRSNLDLKLTEKIKAGFRINYSRIGQNNGTANFGQLLGILPTQPIFNEDGTYNGFDDVIGTPFANPIANSVLSTNKTFTNNLLGTAFVEYSPIKNLILRSTFNPEFNNVKRNIFDSSQRPDFLAVGELGRASVNTVSSIGWNNENTAQYSFKPSDDHNIVLLGGASFQKVEIESTGAQAFGITSDVAGFNNLAFSDPRRAIVTSGFSGFQIVSFFGRANYTYKNKYLFTLVGRTDGSSVFAPGNQYGFYPSAAAAWKISEESFMKNQSFFTDLKLRASYGISGNQAIEPYRTKAILVEANTTLNGVEVPGLTLGRPANPDLGWETTRSIDLALEGSMLDGRIFAEFNYYHKKTRDLLLDVTIPRQTGFTSQLQNVGSLQNQGLELLLNTKNIVTRNFVWNTTLTLSGNRNKVLDLGGVEFIDVVVDPIFGSGNTRIIVGENVPVFTGARYLGTWKTQEEITASGMTAQVVGGPRYEDINGDKIITNQDFVILGSPQPDFIYGLDNSFSYKNFDFSFYFQGTYGNEVYNLRTQTGLFQRGETTKYKEVVNRWTPENPTSNIPRAGSDAVTNVITNSEYVEDGSHFRLKNARIGYNFPTSKFAKGTFKSLTAFAAGTNLFILSNFRLIDPETSRFGASGLGNIAQGFSSGEYPNAKVFTFGLTATF
jgi:TonB-linked SusC/RagA family outer membrane protein